MRKVVLHTYYRANSKKLFRSQLMFTNVETVGPLAKVLFLYLFKLTSFCTDAGTEEAYLRKSYRAEFKLGLAKLTFRFRRGKNLFKNIRQRREIGERRFALSGASSVCNFDLKLTFDSSKITLLSASFQQEHP